MLSALSYVCALVGTIPLGFGINAFIRPEHALSFFNNSSMPTENHELVSALLMVYGIRDIFMGISIYATAFFGNRRAMGLVMIAGFACAMVDGYASKTFLGGGEWDHWGYSPMLALLGVMALI
ncbi:uncharacterized protein PV09_05288 [Verruconis gallopava]|uniref:Integral membrane protein n=1 Tax=Verruconis gallopava TaxID=253628 RepID=A0A0D1YSF1_9PEZI|nr:uncharacterized protein PV09_05288 [Verruconis gallopava]KIW03527.1 hypothetical protein PV09_05288 [Verruconis gallopava]